MCGIPSAVGDATDCGISVMERTDYTFEILPIFHPDRGDPYIISFHGYLGGLRYSVELLQRKQHLPCSMKGRPKLAKGYYCCTKAGSSPSSTNIAVILATLDMSVEIVPTVHVSQRCFEGNSTKSTKSHFSQR